MSNEMRGHDHAAAGVEPATATDPVCGMTVKPGAGKPTLIGLARCKSLASGPRCAIARKAAA